MAFGKSAEGRNFENMKLLLRLSGVLLLGWILTACGEAYTSEAGTDTEIAVLSQQDLLERQNGNGNLLLLDVRTKREYDSGHIAGAVLIPHKQVEKRLDELAKYRDRRIVVYCEVGGRARKVLHVLSKAGFDDLALLEGDMRAWRKSDLPVER
jgi:rhodanese-related sulfurtransferase